MVDPGIIVIVSLCCMGVTEDRCHVVGWIVQLTPRSVSVFVDFTMMDCNILNIASRDDPYFDSVSTLP